MTDATFEADRDAVLADMTAARADLVSIVQAMQPAGLERARRGGWPVSKVIEHVIMHDYLMARMATHIRKADAPSPADMTCAGQSIDEVLCRLEAGRALLLAAVNGVSEDDFYRLEKAGYEEFSVISLLENSASHDREHTAQIRAILQSGA